VYSVMWLIPTDATCSAFGLYLSVCVGHTSEPCSNAELIEMPFGGPSKPQILSDLGAHWHHLTNVTDA